MDSSPIVLDAYCLMNLDASERLQQILSCLPNQSVITEVVWANEIYALGSRSQLGLTQVEIALKEQIIEVVELNEYETDLYIDYAASLRDDGDAASCALTASRSWLLATDDLAVMKFMYVNASHIGLVSSLELIKYWASVENLSKEKLRQILINVRDLGHYIPHRQHQLFEWYNQVME